MGFLSSMADAADTASGGTLSGLGINLPFDAKFKQDNKSGSAPSLASGAYKKWIFDKGLGNKIWFTEASDWAKVFGYRFSIAYINPEAPLIKGDIDQVLSAIDAFKKQTAAGTAADTAFAVADKLTGGLASKLSSLGKEADNANLGEKSLANQTHIKWLHFTLPIPPQQMVTKPIIPSRITATLGGVVEETSSTKFWVLNMSGTTGTASSRLVGDRVTRQQMATQFRTAIASTGLIGGFEDKIASNPKFAKIEAALSSVAAAVDDPFASIVPPSGFGEFDGAGNKELIPPAAFKASAVPQKGNGYAEAQELQKFLYMYSALKGRYPKRFALLFTNWKTDQSWRVAVQDFQLMQSAENPTLVKYSMNLQGWDVRRARGLFDDLDSGLPFDRFGPGGDLSGINSLTKTAQPNGFSNPANSVSAANP